MRIFRIFCIVAVLLLSVTMYALVYIPFTEKVMPGYANFKECVAPKKVHRTNSNRGHINIHYDMPVADSVMVAIDYAKELWENRLQNSTPIQINISFESLGDDSIAMISFASYNERFDYEGFPNSLASQLSNEFLGDIEVPDGYIVFNEDVDWNCYFTTTETESYNIPTMALRGIARCLGFGSSIVEDGEGAVCYETGFPTLFDKLLYVDNKCMTHLSNSSPELKEFVTSNNVVIKSNNTEFDIYSPSEYVQDVSLCYFKEENSLMSHNLGQGNVYLQIDDDTIDVLKALGWNFPNQDVNITCDNISENGIGSAYESHTFSLSADNADSFDYVWNFYVKDMNQEFVGISSGDASTFKISKFQNTDSYYRNINGDIEGVVTCDYIEGGVHKSTNPFSVYLEVKPTIKLINDVKVIPVGDYEAQVLFNATYLGADYITVEVEEEYDSAVRLERFDEPFIAHVQTGNISTLFYTWITVIANNKYGTMYETIEIEPQFVKRKNRLRDSYTYDNNGNFVVYNINGDILYSGAKDDIESMNLPKGLYITVLYMGDDKYTYKKILIR